MAKKPGDRPPEDQEEKGGWCENHGQDEQQGLADKAGERHIKKPIIFREVLQTDSSRQNRASCSYPPSVPERTLSMVYFRTTFSICPPLKENSLESEMASSLVREGNWDFQLRLVETDLKKKTALECRIEIAQEICGGNHDPLEGLHLL